MDIQLILVALLFLVAVIYLVRMIVRNMKPSKSCGGNCKCGVDFSGIEKS